MPYIDAIVFTKWVEDPQGASVPNALGEIMQWGLDNDETLPIELFGPHPEGGKYRDITAQANTHQRILDNLGVFCAKLVVTVATAQHFAADPRIWILGYWRRDDDGTLLDDNWDTTLNPMERQEAVDYVTANSNISAAQLAAAFDASDTRREIAQKLKAFFRG